MHQSLRGYAVAVLGDIARGPLGEQVAEDLNAVAHLVSRTNSLAVALTDFAVPTGARRAILEELLESRVRPEAIRLVLRAVDTERTEEFPTTLHELYELARHLHELEGPEFRAEEPIASRTGWRHFMSGYADAVLESAPDVTELEEIEDELFRFARIVESSPTLRDALSDTGQPPESRQGLVSALLEGKARPATVRLARVAMQGRVRDVVSSLDWLAEQAARARGWRIARVRTARPIDDEEQAALAEALQRITHHPVELQMTEDATLLGGAVVQIGDLLVDATAERRLEQLQDHLLKPEGATRGAQN
ncbi:MAG TPA: F0F1 ATP synthase subunit delta [Acidimicrobiales bacterium]|nr:F0F1 ATP synthase subunit delta [Acidimicrobiales bacterium]